VHPPLMSQHGAAYRSSAPRVTLVPPREYRFNFGLLYLVSKLLKFFKLFGQRLNTESKRAIVSQDIFIQGALPKPRSMCT
jgi:hypothetical protein